MKFGFSFNLNLRVKMLVIKQIYLLKIYISTLKKNNKKKLLV